MARDLARDQKMFNCSQEHEVAYVASLYPGNETPVRAVIEQGCKMGELKNFTHVKVYEYIQQKTGLAPA